MSTQVQGKWHRFHFFYENSIKIFANMFWNQHKEEGHYPCQLREFTRKRRELYRESKLSDACVMDQTTCTTTPTQTIRWEGLVSDMTRVKKKAKSREAATTSRLQLWEDVTT